MTAGKRCTNGLIPTNIRYDRDPLPHRRHINTSRNSALTHRDLRDLSHLSGEVNEGVT